MSGEKSIYQTRLHKIVFCWATIWLLFSILFFIGGALWGGIFFLWLVTFTGLNEFIKYRTSEFGITNKRVIMKAGFIRRTSSELLLNKVESIQVKQGILGRLLNYGTISVIGTGGTKDPFRKIAKPLKFRTIAQEQIAIVHETK